MLRRADSGLASAGVGRVESDGTTAAMREPACASIMDGPMFEYAALVDAPIQRFTGIVTGADPDQELPVLSVATISPVAPPATDVPVLLVAVEVMPVEWPEPPESVDALEPVTMPAALPVQVPAPPKAAPPMVRTFPPRAEPAPSPSLLPALAAITVAGITAMWWLRRNPHDRGR